MSQVNIVKLRNGVEMPQMGYGVYQVAPALCKQCVLDALSIGYRMIDTAQAYHNEGQVGEAIRESGIERKDVFIVTKMWISNYAGDKAARSIDNSLDKLGTDYIDLMLLHQPFCDRYNGYRALEKAYKEGKVRAIGVSNFYPDQFVDLASNVEITPMVNQVETHVFNQQIEARKYMEEFGCRIMSWGPLAEGRNGLFTNELLEEVAKRNNLTVAQVALLYLYQSGVIIIPKTVRKERMIENLDIISHRLPEEDMKLLTKLDLGQSLFFDHHDGEVTKMFMGWRGLV